MVTVEPEANLRSNVLPAGTVKLLITTLVHLTALATSSKEEMVPVQSEVEGAALIAAAKKARTKSGLNWNIVKKLRLFVAKRGEEPVEMSGGRQGLSLGLNESLPESLYQVATASCENANHCNLEVP